MKWSFLLFSSLFCLQAFAQYPATGNKARLGWQTTGDGLVYRGAIGDTTTLDPSGLNNAWMLLDTASGNLYAYRAKAWRLVSGGGGGGLTMPFDSVTFNVNETDASLRELKYSEEKGYLQYGGQDSVQIPILPGIWYVRNDTSVTIPKGTVLRATGTLGASGRIKVKHMIANGSIDAMYILGIAMQDIAVGADGYAMSQGKIRQVNTQAYSEGSVLYADVDTLGGLTQTEPGNGFLKLPIAFVVHSASNGVLAVRVTSGAYMRDLHDVEVTSPATNASLYYNTAQGIWRDTTAAALKSDISGTTNHLAMFTGANTVGNSPLYNVANNQFIIGHTASGTGAKNTLEIRGTGNTDFDGSKVDLYVNSSGQDYHAPIISLRRSRSATAEAFTKANDLDWLGQVIFNGADGDEYTGGALIRAIVDGTTGNNDMPASLLFATTPDGSSTQTERMRITSAGNVGIATASPSRPLHVAGTTAIRIPVGTTAQQGTSANGDIRYNTDKANFEWYSGTGWREPVNAARSPAAGLANRFAKFDANGLLDTSAVLTQSANRIGIGTASPTAGFMLDVVGGDARINGMTVGLGGSNVASNLAFGNGALASWDTTGTGTNVAIGAFALNAAKGKAVFGASSNLAIGGNALRVNTNTANNVAIGADAMRFYNKTGSGAGGGNVAIGGGALYSLEASASTPVANNVAIGLASMLYTQNSDANACIGTNSMRHAQGNDNVAIGQASLASSDPGTPDYRTGINQNVSIGASAMQNIVANTTGNIAIGKSALGLSNYEGDNGVYIGLSANASSTTATNEIVIGANTTGNGSNTTTIGNSSTTKTFFQYGETYIGTATDNGNYNLQVAGGSYLSGEIKYVNRPAAAAVTNVGVDANGVLREATSSQRFKDNISPYQKGLSDAMRLQAKTYTYKGDTTLQAGFIAEDVHEAGLTEYVNYDKEGKPYSLQYGNMVTLLLNAMKEQQAQIEALKKEIEALKNK